MNTEKEVERNLEALYILHRAMVHIKKSSDRTFRDDTIFKIAVLATRVLAAIDTLVKDEAQNPTLPKREPYLSISERVRWRNEGNSIFHNGFSSPGSRAFLF